MEDVAFLLTWNSGTILKILLIPSPDENKDHFMLTWI
jgi:hypothetical protein